MALATGPRPETTASGDATLAGTSGSWVCQMVAIQNPQTSIKTINGVAKSSVKTVNGLAIASVKTIDGLA